MAAHETGDSALPDEGWALALASLTRMGRGRLNALFRRWTPPQAWAAIATEAAFSDAGFVRACGKEADQLRWMWASEVARADPVAMWERALAADVHVAIRSSAHYPALLAQDLAPPALLTWRGDVGALDARRVAIVGTRNATSTGRWFARVLGHELAANGVAVVSGLAEGIDAAAHRGALAAEGVPPIGVVGSGLEVVYPRSSADLWEAVGKRGVLFSEVPLDGSPQTWQFPERNRIIAALAEIVVVVESRIAGGSMITVTEAHKRDRQVMAVPGSVRSAASAGTNGLLYDGASPVRDVIDVLVALGLSSPRRPTLEGGERRERVPAERDDAELLALFGDDALSFDDLATATGASLHDLALRLGRLEGDDWVERQGAWYRRRRP